MTLPASHCPLCSAVLRCGCGTYDDLHESSCELLGICSNCSEQEIDRIPDGPEPDGYLDHIKDLTLSEIDALVIDCPDYPHTELALHSVHVSAAA